jgi:hypothetical protein
LENSPPLAHPEILRHAISYALERERSSPERRARAEAITREATAALETARGAAEQIGQIEQDRILLLEEWREMVSRQQAAWENEWKTKSNEIDAQLKARLDLGSIEQPVALWRNLASTHRVQYNDGVWRLSKIVGGLGTGGLVLLVILYALLSDATQTLSARGAATIAIVLGLMAAIGYVLKITGRLVTNSLTLAEDADIRGALTDTYLRLKASGDLDDKDRTIMLAALFRPLPGHQQEDIEAPTVLSIAKDITMRKG